jgi:urease accessory protein
MNPVSGSTFAEAAGFCGTAGESRCCGQRTLAAASEGWLAELHLRFARLNNRTLLVDNRHCGPLRVQKALYPEGEAVCHAVIIHPPGGIAGGDYLRLEIDLEPGSVAVLTTPGAAKWYKAPRNPSRQEITIRLGKGSRLDWLPQENIFFNAARAESLFKLQIEPDATAAGWEIGMLGRQASSERWLEGSLRWETSILGPDGAFLWVERMLLDATSRVRNAPQGLSGFDAFGTLWVVGSEGAANLAEELSASLPFESDLRAGATSMAGGVLLIRALAKNVERIRQLMIACWTRLRPTVHGLQPQAIRLWAT